MGWGGVGWGAGVCVWGEGDGGRVLTECYGSYPRLLPVLTPAQWERKFCLLFPFQFLISLPLSFILLTELFL